MAKLDEQISVLQDRLGQLKQRQLRLDARKRALASVRERKAELRRQILIGALVLGKMRDGGLDADLVRGWLDSSLSRPQDRALFDLPPVAGPKA